jgi:aspartyl-tRNA synthetase
MGPEPVPQLDIEMSFIDQADILAVAEKLLVKIWKKISNFLMLVKINTAGYWLPQLLQLARMELTVPKS